MELIKIYLCDLLHCIFTYINIEIRHNNNNKYLLMLNVYTNYYGIFYKC